MIRAYFVVSFKSNRRKVYVRYCESIEEGLHYIKWLKSCLEAADFKSTKLIGGWVGD